MKQRVHIVATAYDKRGHLICVSPNDYNRSHPEQKRLSILCGMSDQRDRLHAELACLVKAKSLRKQVHTLVVERYSKDGTMRLAMPCVTCQAAIKIAGVRVVRFTSEYGWKVWIP